MTDPMHDPAAVGPEGLDVDMLIAAGRQEAADDRRIARMMRQRRNAMALVHRAVVTERLCDALAAACAEVERLTALDGATEPGGEGTWPSDAGEFAARWNARDVEQRNGLLQLMVSEAATAERCLVMDHDGCVAERDEARAALARVEALFSAGPDTPCRTTWRADGFLGSASTECVEVPMADLHAALSAAPSETGEGR